MAPEFAAGSGVTCHPNLSQQNFIFREMIPVAIIDWDGTRPGPRLPNVAEFLWAFVHPGMYGEGEPAARMLRVAADAYGPRDSAVVDGDAGHRQEIRPRLRDEPGSLRWGLGELAHLERNADLFRARLAP
jgi:hypothetical protein